MKKKQVLAAVLAAVMGASMLAGCGNSAESGNVSSENESSQAASSSETEQQGQTGQEPAELEPVELVWNIVGTPQDDQDTVFAEVNKVLQEKLNTTVQFNVIDWGAYDEKMKVAIATDEDYDICFTSDWTNPYVSNAQKGAYYPMTELLEKYAPHIMEQVPESYWDATRVGGEIYGVVNYQVTARIEGGSFPADTVEELGYDVSKITSWPDMTDYFATVQEKKPDMIPFLGGGQSMPMLISDEKGFEMDYLSGPLAVRAEDPTKALNGVETQEFMDYCKLMRDWYEKGYVRKDVASITDTKGEVKTHKYAAFSTGVGPGSPQVESANAGFTVVQAQTVPAYVSTGTIQAALTAISINCEYPDRAMMLLDYLFEDKDLYNMLCYGIEGKHYEKVNDYSIKVIEDGGYNPGIAWEFGSWFNAMLLEGQDEDHWDQIKEINETALTSPVLGFVYNPDNVKNEMAQITALMSEYLPGLLTGSVDPEEKIPELIEKMNAAGMDKIIEDANAQLAAWNS